MFAFYSNVVQVLVLITTLFCHRYNSYEISSKNSLTRSPSHQIDSSFSPHDQFNYHLYHWSDQHKMNPQRRQTTLNAIPSHSQKYEGWKPIVSSQRLQAPGEKYSQYSSTTTVVPTSIINDANGQTETTIELTSTVPFQQIKRTIVKEDDIMRMHYGANEDDGNQTENLSPVIEEKRKNSANHIESNKQFDSQYRFDQMATTIRHNPKNIYEIMESNSPPTFKPIAQSIGQSSFQKGDLEESHTKNTNDWSTTVKNSNYLVHNWIENKIPVEVEKESTANNIFNVRDKEQVVKVDSVHLPPIDKMLSYPTQTDITNTRPIHVEPTKETSLGNGYISAKNLAEKDDKFSDKPIIIAEQAESLPYFTAEYYRKLFDSFGRRDKSFDNANKFSNDIDSSTNMTAKNQTDIKSEIMSANCTSDSITCKISSNELENRTSHTLRHKHRFNIIKFMGVDMNDLMPKTLRFNIYLIRKLFAQCYSELQGEDFSPIVCLKKITIKVLDNAIGKNIIKLTDNVSLVKENVTAITEFESSRSSSTSADWLPSIVDKMAKLFSTHSLKVQLENSQKDHKFQIEGRRRHYRRVFPIVVGAYMILSTVLIPLGFKFMTLLGTKSLLLSKLSLMISLMGGLKKIFGYGTEAIVHSYYTPTYYPTAAHPPTYPSYYDPWRRDEFRKISHYDEPAIDYSHLSEEIE